MVAVDMNADLDSTISRLEQGQYVTSLDLSRCRDRHHMHAARLDACADGPALGEAPSDLQSELMRDAVRWAHKSTCKRSSITTLGRRVYTGFTSPHAHPDGSPT